MTVKLESFASQVGRGLSLRKCAVSGGCVTYIQQ